MDPKSLSSQKRVTEAFEMTKSDLIGRYLCVHSVYSNNLGHHD